MRPLGIGDSTVRSAPGNLQRQDSYAASESTAFSLPDLGSSAGSVADFAVHGGGTRAVGELRPLLRASRPMPYGSAGEYSVFLTRTLLHQRFGLALTADPTGVITVAEDMLHLDMRKGDLLLSINSKPAKSVECCRQVLDVALRLELRLQHAAHVGKRNWFLGCVGRGPVAPEAPPPELMKDLLSASLPTPRGAQGEFSLIVSRESMYQKYGISFGTDVELGLPRDPQRHWPIVIAEDAPHLGLLKGDRLKYINNTPAMVGGRCQSILDRSVHAELVLQRRGGDVSTQRQYAELLHAHLKHSASEQAADAIQKSETSSWSPFAFLFACHSLPKQKIDSKAPAETISPANALSEARDVSENNNLQAISENVPVLALTDSPKDAQISDSSTLDTEPVRTLKDLKSSSEKPNGAARPGELDYVLGKIGSISESLNKDTKPENSSLNLNLGAGVGTLGEEHVINGDDLGDHSSATEKQLPFEQPLDFNFRASFVYDGSLSLEGTNGAQPSASSKRVGGGRESWSKGLDAWLTQQDALEQRGSMNTVPENEEFSSNVRSSISLGDGDQSLERIRMRAKVRAFAKSLTRGVTVKVPGKEHTSHVEFHDAKMRLGKSSDKLEKLVVEVEDQAPQGFLLVHVHAVYRYEEALKQFSSLSQDWPVEEGVQERAAVLHYDSQQLFCIVEHSNRWREQFVQCFGILGEYARARSQR